MIASVVVLGLLAAALLAVLVVRERDHARERDGLLDRIQAPEAARAAATARVLPSPVGVPVSDPDDAPLGEALPVDPDLFLLGGTD